MRTSSERILTTHVGSLPRPADLSELLFAKARDEPVDPAVFEATVARAVDETLRRQRETGIDIPSDGEMSKISYATYVVERLTGFEGDTPRDPPADLEAYPSYMRKLAQAGGTPTYRRPRCTGPVKVRDLRPLHADIARMKAAMAAHGYEQGFMNAASPGVIALFLPSDWHPSQDAYLADLADAMREEYRTIVESGLVLQIDSPDLGLGRHTLYKQLDEDAFLERAARHLEALDHALDGLPADRVRIHVCWGNYEGPHHCDIALARILPLVLRAKPRALLFEASNPRHAHEWTVFEEVRLPDDYVLIPGCIDSTTNFVEHPELVAQRICTYARLVGRERVLAGTDCGFATFAGYGAVDPEIAWAKLAALADGARLGSARLWGRGAAA